MVYPEGGTEGLILRQKTLCECPVETTLVQLKSLRPVPEQQITESKDVVNIVKDMEDFDREHVRILHLDSKNRVIGIETIGIGALDMAIVHPREILKGAILSNSSGIIEIHNHPSGDCTPSTEDQSVAKVLEQACELVGIKFLDSIIIGKECYSSKECPRCTMPSGEQRA